MNSDEEIAAALILCQMKHSKISLELEEETKNLTIKKHPSSASLFPSPSLYNHRTRLLSLVPPSLAGIIGNYSTPFEKQLTDTDLRTNQVRLLLKYKYVIQSLFPLLRPNEVDQIKKKEAIVVPVYDSLGRMYEMEFKLWASKSYVITKTTWLQFCNDHGFVAFLDWVTVWMFRHNVTDRICFFISSERRDVEKLMVPVFDFPTVARKKRTKSCRISDSNSKRRRLDDGGGGRISFVITSERRYVEKLMLPVFDFPTDARKKRIESCSISSSNSKRRRLDDIIQV